MSTQRAIRAAAHDVSLAGTWSIVVRPPGKAPVDISLFRGKPTQLGSYSFSDPFGPSSLEFRVPQVSMFERRGAGDLAWAVKQADVNIVWTGDLPSSYPFGHRNGAGVVTPQFSWEGYLTTFGYSRDGLRVQCKGAMLQMDRYLAKPEYTARPLPYEFAIARQFVRKPALRLMPLRVVWPSWWSTVYNPVAGAPSWMIPAGVTKGQKWTNLLTRETGSWDPTLTSYIQTLLGSMYTDRGRFTLMLDSNRQPVLYHQDLITLPGPSVAVINPASPGLEVDLTEDWEQSVTDVYAQGTSLAGVSYSGMQVSSDGTTTAYLPAAALRQTFPTSIDNGWFDRDVMPQEVLIQAQQGLSADDAQIVGRSHLMRFSDPGVVGTITLEHDPLLNGDPISRFLIRAGMALQLPMFGGDKNGLVVHVTDSAANFDDGTVALTVDSKFRDALTVEEVRKRGRDALSISRALVAGQYQPPIPDQMMPWSYGEGSGYIPSNSVRSALPLFNGMPQFTPFPWTDWIKSRPPRDRRWANCYIRIGPASSTANNNWAVQKSPWGSNMGTPIRMGQAGTVKLLQIAAYDRDGNVLKVPFHVGFYYVGSVNVLTMPAIPVEQAAMFPPYKAGQRYPFVRDAFEALQRDGTRVGKNDPKAYESAGPVRIYGTFYNKAGYSPGSQPEGDVPTGLLIDETQWSWDLTSVGDALWDPYSIERNYANPHAGNIYAMIYCDAQQDQEVFFAGRIFRVEPGTGGA